MERVKQGRIMDSPQGCASELYVLTLAFLPTVLSMLYLCFASVEKSLCVDCGKIAFHVLTIIRWAILRAYLGNFLE